MKPHELISHSNNHTNTKQKTAVDASHVFQEIRTESEVNQAANVNKKQKLHYAI